MYDSRQLTGEAPFIFFRGAEGWKVRSRGQANQCLKSGIADVGRRWMDEGRGVGARLMMEELALNWARIEGATILAAAGVQEAVIKKKGM